MTYDEIKTMVQGKSLNSYTHTQQQMNEKCILTGGWKNGENVGS